MYVGGETMANVSSAFGISKSSVFNILTKNKIEKRPRNYSRLCDSEICMIIRLYLSGMSVEEVGKSTKYNHKTISRVLKQSNTGRRGSKKLQEAQKDFIVNNREIATSTEIAKSMGFSLTSVNSFLRKQNLPSCKRSERLLRYSCNDNYFGQLTPDTCYVAGFIAADGCVHDKRKSIALSIGLGIKDKDHLEKIKQQLQCTHPISISKSKTNVKCSLSIISKQLTADLYSHFKVTPRKSLTLEWPDHLPDELARHFLRGYFDGDGTWHSHIRKNTEAPRLLFQLLGTTSFLEGARDLIVRSCGVSPVAIYQPRATSQMRAFNYAGNRVSSRIAQWLYRDADLYLTRKAAIAQPFIEKFAHLPLLTSRRNHRAGS